MAGSDPERTQEEMQERDRKLRISRIAKVYPGGNAGVQLQNIQKDLGLLSDEENASFSDVLSADIKILSQEGNTTIIRGKAGKFKVTREEDPITHQPVIKRMIKIGR